MVNFAEMYEAQSKAVLNGLRDDIKTHGVTTPVKVARDGRIVSGHTRAAIANELGIKYQTLIVDGNDDALVAIAVMDNPQRKVKAKERAAIAMALHRSGWSNYRIADALGVTHSTIRTDLSTSKNLLVDEGQPVKPEPARTIGKDGKSRPAKRSTKDEVERRRELVAYLVTERYGRDAICASLGMAHGTVHSDMAALHVEFHKPIRLDQPPTLYWRDDDADKFDKNGRAKRTKKPQPPKIDEPTSETPKWTDSVVLRPFVAYAVAYHERDYPNVFANHIMDAELAKKTELAGVADRWLSEAKDVLQSMAYYIGNLQRILDDPQYRERQLTGLRLDESQVANLRRVK